MPHNSSIPLPLLEREIHLGAPTALEPDSLDLCPMDVDDAKSPDDPFPDFGDLAASPMCCSLPDLHYDVEDPFDGSPFPISPSQRSFADFPEDTTAIEPSRSPPQSRFLRVARPPLLTLPAIIHVLLVAFQVEQQKVLRDSVYMRRYRCGWKKPFLWEFTLYLNLCWNVMAFLEEMLDVEGKEDWTQRGGGARGRDSHRQRCLEGTRTGSPPRLP
ncbi:hypothetical protein BGW80DRAFT_1510495 [Lactifluus volemus]|nr:hypothetical protein BGW80DRAFT_1510495 [Lactifluus volemus]